MNIKSPITKSDNICILKKIESKVIIDLYAEVFSIDVARHFKDVDFISICKCQDTGYTFFYPYGLDGDADFYKQLELIDWYYQDWKWEYDIAKKIIGNDNNLLEIGCGKGAFLKEISKENRCVGLEINDNNLKKESHFTIVNKRINDYADFSSELYDWIVAFQLLEHLADIEEFFVSSSKLLNDKGRLLIAVPNNKSYFFKKRNFYFKEKKYLETLLLNSPPHHMGLWDIRSLEKVGSFFGFSLELVVMEPISNWRRDLNLKLLRIFFIYRFIEFILGDRLTYRILSFINKNKYANGDSIIVVYKKN